MANLIKLGLFSLRVEWSSNIMGCSTDLFIHNEGRVDQGKHYIMATRWSGGS